MATAAPTQNLPMFYSDLKPLNVSEHRNAKIRRIDKAPFIANSHAVPATVDEFALLQRHYPIIFSVGEKQRVEILKALIKLKHGFGPSVSRVQFFFGKHLAGPIDAARDHDPARG